MSAKFLATTPLLPAGAGLQEAVDFYTGQMGFSLLWQTDTMAGVARDGLAFNLVQNTNKEWASNCSCSIGVSDLDGLYAEYKDMPGARIGPLEMKAWGQREFHMIVPSGTCFQFYQRES